MSIYSVSFHSIGRDRLVYLLNRRIALDLKNTNITGEYYGKRNHPYRQGAAGDWTYSQAVKTGNTVYMSGQIPLVPESMELVAGDMGVQIRRVFDNLQAVAEAAGGDLQDIAKLNIFLTDLSHFPLVNEVMAEYFQQPYPARAAIGVSSLPKGAGVEMDAVMELE